MPLIRDYKQLEEEEENILKIIRGTGEISHGELIQKIVDTLCCSPGEAEALIRKLANKGYISRRGSTWRIKRR